MFFDLETIEWYKSARCAEIGGDEWYPEDSCLGNTAKKVCQECPVQVECLEYALVNNERYGIWGGRSPNERKKLLRQRRLAG